MPSSRAVARSSAPRGRSPALSSSRRLRRSRSLAPPGRLLPRPDASHRPGGPRSSGGRPALSVPDFSPSVRRRPRRRRIGSRRGRFRIRRPTSGRQRGAAWICRLTSIRRRGPVSVCRPTFGRRHGLVSLCRPRSGCRRGPGRTVGRHSRTDRFGATTHRPAGRRPDQQRAEEAAHPLGGAERRCVLIEAIAHYAGSWSGRRSRGRTDPQGKYRRCSAGGDTSLWHGRLSRRR